MDQRTDKAPGATTANAKPAEPTRFQKLTRRFGFRLSPVNRRRLERFKAHKLGYRSFLIFMGLFLITLFAEFIANDRPLIVSYKGEILFPVLVDYPEEKFGGFLAVTDYRTPDIAQRDQRQRLDALAADPLFLRHDQQGLPRPHRRQRHLSRLSRAAALGLIGQALRRAGRSGRALQGASATPTGSASTIRAATSLRASSTASASRCCSA